MAILGYILSIYQLPFREKYKKKADDKITSARFRKTCNINCIMLKNQRLEGKNTVDPDETAQYEPVHLDLQCLQIQLLLCLALSWIEHYMYCISVFHYIKIISKIVTDELHCD